MPTIPKSGTKKKSKHQNEVIHTCLEVLQKGNIKDLLDLLPKISVLRDPSFIPPLLMMLKAKTLGKREFAALGLAELEASQTLTALCECLHEKPEKLTPSYRRFQSALLQSIGHIGSDKSVDCLTKLLESRKKQWSEARWKGKIIDALGQIAQQGGKKALDALEKIIKGRNIPLAVEALQEISVAFWPCPNAIPPKLFDLFTECLSSKHRELQDAAWEVMEDLARLGCRRAEKLLSSSS